MIEKNKLNFGFIGIGQGGNKIIDRFAEEFEVLAINTAYQDLNGLKNVPDDRRIYTKINDCGGVGKEIRLGNEAIKSHKEEIKENIEVAFSDIDYIFTAAGLGGGSGTLGLTQVNSILADMGKKQGIIATLPSKSEGTYEQINTNVGWYMIEQARERFYNTLRTVIVVDNEELKRK